MEERGAEGRMESTGKAALAPEQQRATAGNERGGDKHSSGLDECSAREEKEFEVGEMMS